MSNRFERLFQLPANQYIEGSPVLLVAGVLSKDTETGSIITQLKFQSVSEKCIRAIKISLYAYDVSKTEIQGVNDYQYLELDITNGQEFGSNKAIVMPNPVTRSFAISSIVVVFKDGSKWESSAHFNVLPAAKVLPFENAEMAKQYRIATNDAAKYVPIEENELWCCSCGIWNKYSACTNCRIAKNKVFSAFDPAALAEQMNIRLQAERARKEELARMAAEKEVARKILIKKILKYAAMIGIPILVVVLLFNLWINPYIIQPHKQYTEAQTLVEAGKYEEALAIFEDLGDYKDSQEQAAFVSSVILEQKYQKAIELLNSKQYESAYKGFLALQDFKDSPSYVASFGWLCIEEYSPADYTLKFKYDETGKLISKSEDDYDSEVLDRTYKYSYDSDGKLCKVEEFEYDGDLYTVTTYTYDKNGLLTEAHEDWKYFEYLTKYTYDSNGYVITEERYTRDKDEGPDYTLSTMYTYVNDNDGRVLSKVYTSSRGESKYEYTYDENGLCISHKVTEPGKVWNYTYNYDEYNRLASLKRTNPDGKTHTITYKYDWRFDFEKLNTLTNPDKVYAEAERLLAEKQYTEAIKLFESLNGYKDSTKRISEIYNLISDDAYTAAIALLENGQYEKAISEFEALGNYLDSQKYIEIAKKAITERDYSAAKQYFETGQYEKAISTFKKLDNYLDSKEYVNKASYALAEQFLSNNKVAEAAITFGRISNYSDSLVRSLELWNGVAERNTLAAGEFATMAIKRNGSVVVTGGYTKYDFSNWTNMVSVCSGDSHYVGLKADGTVVATGYNSNNQCDVSTWKNIVSISAGSMYTVGLKADGTVIAVGSNDLGQCNVSEWTDIVAVYAGHSHTIGLKADGTVVATGNNGDGQCNVSSWTGIVDIGIGVFHTVGLKSDGTVVAVGANSDDQCNVSKWSGVVDIAAGYNHSIGLKSDGTVVTTKRFDTDIAEWKNIVAVSAGNYFTVGLKANGTVVAAGRNNYEQCDVSKWTDIRVP